MAPASRAAAEASPARMRLDKWLWCARFYRTRTLAAQAVDVGHVRVGGERVKTSHPVGPGQVVEVRRHGFGWTVEVLAIAERRGGAPEAALLYRETAESAAARAQALADRAAAAGARTPGRPTKRDRRKLEDFLNEP
jgi:ribosome-associated heat shock protein Hsp15